MVSKGDTLWEIARGYALSVSDLSRWNKTRILQPDQCFELSGHGDWNSIGKRTKSKVLKYIYIG